MHNASPVPLVAHSNWMPRQWARPYTATLEDPQQTKSGAGEVQSSDESMEPPGWRQRQLWSSTDNAPQCSPQDLAEATPSAVTCGRYRHLRWQQTRRRRTIYSISSVVIRMFPIIGLMFIRDENRFKLPKHQNHVVRRLQQSKIQMERIERQMKAWCASSGLCEPKIIASQLEFVSFCFFFSCTRKALNLWVTRQRENWRGSLIFICLIKIITLESRCSTSTTSYRWSCEAGRLQVKVNRGQQNWAEKACGPSFSHTWWSVVCFRVLASSLITMFQFANQAQL